MGFFAVPSHSRIGLRSRAANRNGGAWQPAWARHFGTGRVSLYTFTFRTPISRATTSQLIGDCGGNIQELIARRTIAVVTLFLAWGRWRSTATCELMSTRPNLVAPRCC